MKVSKGVMALAISAVALVILASVLYIYLRPSGIKDSDGDGVADWKDSFPLDSTIWSVASATINVTIVNEYGRDLNYEFFYYVGGSPTTFVKEGAIANGSSVVATLVPSWATGDVNTTSCHLSVWCYYYGPDIYGNNTLYDAGLPGKWITLSPDQVCEETITIRPMS